MLGDGERKVRLGWLTSVVLFCNPEASVRGGGKKRVR
jgi:hypothetical protein